MTENSVLIFGATSAIGRAIAGRLAEAKTPLLLAGRDAAELERVAKDISVRFGTLPTTVVFAAEAFASYKELFAGATAAHELGGMVLCHGDTPETSAHGDPLETRRIVDVNFTSAAALLAVATPYFEERKRGWLCAVGSVAGDRGRQSNYLYGAAKGALAIYLSGLRQRLAKVGVQVLTVKPGFVDSAMTWGRPGLFLVATPDRVARDVLRAVAKKKNVIYTPWFWWGIMAVIRSIPERIFKRLAI